MGITSVISWCVFGLIVGAIARLIMPGRQNFGLLATMILGIVGSFVGGFLSTLLFSSSDSFVNPAGWIMSVIGALLSLYIYGRLQSKA